MIRAQAWFRRAALAFALSSAPVALSAQVVRGIVHDSTTGLPIAGAVVSLLDTANHAVVRTLTDQGGRFALTASIATVRLQALNIGHLPRELDIPKPGPDGSVTLDLLMARIPVRLEAMHTSGVTVASLCPRPPDDGLGGALWEQARTEFLAAVVARDATKGMIRLLSYEREIDEKNGRITHQRTSIVEGLTSNPAFAARSAAAFAASGYIDTADVHFYGPDVDVLLDVAFAGSHCFQLERADASHRGQVGVSFVPMRARRMVADIAGVLWLDSTDHAIRTLEYRYTNVSHPVTGALGGILTFRVLANGVPLIEHWVIRASPFAWVTTASTAIVTPQRGPPAGGAATGEIGAEVLQATWSDSARWTAALGTVMGQIRVSKGASPQGPLEVSLLGTTYAASSDTSGSFLLTAILPGRYTVVATDPLLTPFQLAVEARETVVDVIRDSVVRLDLAIPKARADVIAGLCHHPPPARTSDLLFRLEALDGSALPSVKVGVSTIGVPGCDRPECGAFVPQQVRFVPANSTGSFVACGIAWETELHVRAIIGKDTVDHKTTIRSGGVLDTLTVRLPATRPPR